METKEERNKKALMRNRIKRSTFEGRAAWNARMREYNKRPEARAKRKERDNREHVKERGRAYARLKKTGMNDAVRAKLMILQNGCCAVCGTLFSGEGNLRAHADHDHVTKKARGLLCHYCNIAEGMIKETGAKPEDFARRLQHYLTNPPADILELT